MTKLDPEISAHQEWIGFVQPTGLVVSSLALVRAGAVLDRRDTEGQRLLRGCVEERMLPGDKEPAPCLPDFRAFAQQVLEWSFSAKGYAGTPENPIPPEIEVPLPEYEETLRPDFAVREPDPQNGRPPWQLIIRVLDPGRDFDHIVRGTGQLEASAHGRMERLLRQTGVPAGLLFNGRVLRLVSAPRGESSGWMDFRVAEMVQTAGRPISTAIRLLLGQSRLLSLPRAQRLAALLDDSRKFQNEVSERLAEQVLHALYELLRGFQAAHDASKSELLRKTLAEHPDEVYRALLTVILRLVFLLYAEERDMLPEDETFLRYYSLASLYERLREDTALYPDTMDQRYGAWAQLLVLFRIIHDGAESGSLRLPKRHGVLFDPDRFPFLEGHASIETQQGQNTIEPPLVPDGTIYRALEKLLVLDGERISYRALDVEQIGSVYETMMGFRLETSTGRSVAIRADKRHGAPTTVDLEVLLGESRDKREKWLQDRTERKFADTAKKAVKDADTVEDLHAALQPAIDLAASPDLIPKDAMVLQPSEERRRSGSHYTPRSLTEPIVRTTLEPILARMRGPDGRPPRPDQILDLKVCDPAMGSGAFLVEACRQLGDALIDAWNVHGGKPQTPPDEDEVIFARRFIAQRCLYGVDKNPVAVDLAKVSLWLVTLAKDHALTFVDHALRHGDSLVGLSRKQIEAFHWDPDAGRFQTGFETMRVREHVSKVGELRQRIRNADESLSDLELRDLWNQAQLELSKARLFGDLVFAAFFESEKPKERERKRTEYANSVVRGEAERYRSGLGELRYAEQPLVPFHWEIEFPEVFEREHTGFEAIVGNPPFMGGKRISGSLGNSYAEWLKTLHAGASGNADLVAHFYRRAFGLLRDGGAFGLIATNTVSQGDTRRAGLAWLGTHGGEIINARRRVRWPGSAAVVVSVVVVTCGEIGARRFIDDKPVDFISAFLSNRGTHEDPARLLSNQSRSFIGCDIKGQGFLFSDDDQAATPVSTMQRLIQADPRNTRCIRPYIGGEELNTSPTQSHHRWVIHFGEMDEAEARQWPDLMQIVEEKVKPERATKSKDLADWPWWRFWRLRGELEKACGGLGEVLAVAQTGDVLAFAFKRLPMTFSHTVVVFPSQSRSLFAVLQCRIHESWARFFAATMKDDARYIPKDCFETFPLPENWETRRILEAAGKAYYDFRADLMLRNNEGLTKTYNRFHDHDERGPEILKLRELHAAMDRAVLESYGWTDIPTDCEFLLDYEIDEEEWGDKKKPWRYRWPNEVRDEVLARLLELNAERAKEEARAGTTATKKRGKKSAAKSSTTPSDKGELFS